MPVPICLLALRVTTKRSFGALKRVSECKKLQRKFFSQNALANFGPNEAIRPMFHVEHDGCQLRLQDPDDRESSFDG